MLLINQLLKDSQQVMTLQIHKWTCYYTLYDFNYVLRSGVRKAVTTEGKMVEYIVTEDNTKVYTIRSNYQINSPKSFNGKGT